MLRWTRAVPLVCAHGYRLDVESSPVAGSVHTRGSVQIHQRPTCLLQCILDTPPLAVEFEWAPMQQSGASLVYASTTSRGKVVSSVSMAVSYQ